MRRDPSLIPFSHFHRSCLFVALMAKKNAPSIEGYPDDFQSKVDYVKAFSPRLKAHFEKEEKLWEKTVTRHLEIKDIVDELKAQRKEIHNLLNQLETLPSEEVLHQFGEDFEHHVRTEERKYFQAIQEYFSPEELKKLVQ